jgi:RNA polymerase sigma-70 factor (ECF subfamily)
LWVIAAAVLGRKTDAEDVLQEAAMIALRKISDFEEGTNFGAWMGGIVRNVARNYARKRRRRATSDVDPQAIDASRAAHSLGGGVGGGGWGPITPSLDPHGRVDADEAGFDDRVLKALNTLDETARACLLLRTLRDMPYREISQLLEIPEGTAMSHVHRARAALRAMLAEGEGSDR